MDILGSTEMSIFEILRIVLEKGIEKVGSYVYALIFHFLAKIT